MPDDVLEQSPTEWGVPYRVGIWIQKLCRLLNRHSSFSGSVTLSGGTKAVTFTRPEPDTGYQIAITLNANETPRWASKATTGFTINSSNAGSTASADYTITRTRT